MEFGLQRIHHYLEKFSIRIRYFRDGEVFSSVGSRQFAGDLSRPALQLRLCRFRRYLFPFTNIGI